jgi:hypothetical protein
MAMNHVQGGGNFNVAPATVTTMSVTLGSAITAGNLVLVAIQMALAVTALTVTDGSSFSYVLTPHSPTVLTGFTASTYLLYNLNAASTSGSTVTASWTTGSNLVMYVDEFHADGAWQFDQDAAQQLASPGSTTVNGPTITPNFANSLVYMAAGSGGTITAPTAGGTLGGWTGAPGGIQNGDMSEYQLNVNGAVSADFTQNQSSWHCMGMAFYAPTAGNAGSGWWQMPPFMQG